MQKSLSLLIKKTDKKSGILLLTDIFGSTQCNVCMKFIRKGRIELVTGYNLPMLIKLAMLLDSMPLSKLAEKIRNYGRKQIRHINARTRCV